jgi:hypothetical protein
VSLGDIECREGNLFTIDTFKIEYVECYAIRFMQSEVTLHTSSGCIGQRTTRGRGHGRPCWSRVAVLHEEGCSAVRSLSTVWSVLINSKLMFSTREPHVPRSMAYLELEQVNARM